MRRYLLVALAMFMLVLRASAVSAQTPAGDSWKITVTPYMLGASMNGTAAVKGQEVIVDMPFSDIMSNLQFGAMGLVVARKGPWWALPSGSDDGSPDKTGNRRTVAGSRPVQGWS
jgi:hypothetical protein